MQVDIIEFLTSLSFGHAVALFIVLLLLRLIHATIKFGRTDHLEKAHKYLDLYIVLQQKEQYGDTELEKMASQLLHGASSEITKETEQKSPLFYFRIIPFTICCIAFFVLSMAIKGATETIDSAFALFDFSTTFLPLLVISLTIDAMIALVHYLVFQPGIRTFLRIVRLIKHHFNGMIKKLGHHGSAPLRDIRKTRNQEP